MANIKTTLHYDTYNLHNPDEKRAYEALMARLNEAGMRPQRMECWARASNEPGAMEFRECLRALDGREVELEIKHLFDNQWNTAPIKGLSDNGLRVFDWQDASFPDVRHVRQVQWLEQTEEMKVLREGRVACGYCGHQHDAPEGGFCDRCLDSPYLKEDGLHLLRLRKIANTSRREPLSDWEVATLLPLYRKAQLHGNARRAAKMTNDALEKIERKRAKSIADAEREADGMRWLLREIPGVYENAIYYGHAETFGFGWRSKLDKQGASDLHNALASFPYRYRIECSDGSRLEGGQ